ncbi:hypothetical protein ACMFMF_007273 [Clarireedia jacksonii]
MDSIHDSMPPWILDLFMDDYSLSPSLSRSPIWDDEQSHRQRWPGDDEQPFDHMAYMYPLDPSTEDSTYPTLNNPMGIRIWENAFCKRRRSNKSRITNGSSLPSQPRNPPANDKKCILANNLDAKDNGEYTGGECSSSSISPLADLNIVPLGSRILCEPEPEPEPVYALQTTQSPVPLDSYHQSNYSTQVASSVFFPPAGGWHTEYTVANGSPIPRHTPLLPSLGQEIQQLHGVNSRDFDELQRDNGEGPSRQSSPSQLGSNTPSVTDSTTSTTLHIRGGLGNEKLPENSSRASSDSGDSSNAGSNPPSLKNVTGLSSSACNLSPKIYSPSLKTPIGPSKLNTCLPSESQLLSLKDSAKHSSPKTDSRSESQSPLPKSPASLDTDWSSEGDSPLFQTSTRPLAQDAYLSSEIQDKGKDVEVAVDDWKPAIVSMLVNGRESKCESLHYVTPKTEFATLDLPETSNSGVGSQSHRLLGPCGTGEMRYKNPVTIEVNDWQEAGIQRPESMTPPSTDLQWSESSFKMLFNTEEKREIAGPWWRTHYSLLGEQIEMPKLSRFTRFWRASPETITRYKLPVFSLGSWQDTHFERGPRFVHDLDPRNPEGRLLPNARAALRRHLYSPRVYNRDHTIYTLTEETLQECHRIVSPARASEIRRLFKLGGSSNHRQV